MKRLRFQKPFMKEGELLGEILYIDTFGNLVSNIDEETFFRFIMNRPFVVNVGRKAIHGLKNGYWEGDQGELMALLGSGGFLEVSVREGDAQKMLKVKRGDPVKVTIGR
jgi:S-adenosylmethionine hydrolase